MELTFVMIKPDGVQRNLAGTIISRFENKGLKLVGMKLLRLNRKIAEEHYREHMGKSFYAGLISYIISGPVVAMVWEGRNVVSVARKLIGATNPGEAETGSIRGAYGIDMGRNVIHGSDSPESAKREISLFFNPAEIIDYEKTADTWVYE
jgi:nucleoside-diphosphate kinase